MIDDRKAARRQIGAQRAYTGIGSRSTPPAVLNRMRELAAMLAGEGYELRSGAADGADTACERGCDEAGGRKSIFLPWAGFQDRKPDPAASTYLPPPQASMIAATLHPRWAMLGRGPKSLHSRNVPQVLGHELDDPSDFVLCWTPDGAQSSDDVNAKTGGTGTAIRLAAIHSVPVFNLARDETEERLHAFLATRHTERASVLIEAVEPESEPEPEPRRVVLRFPG